jgi:hypothetical protein
LVIIDFFLKIDFTCNSNYIALGGINNALHFNELNINNWLAIQLRGVKSNKFGAGAKVSIQYTVNGKVK